MHRYFNNPLVRQNETVLFGDFILFGQAKENRIYEELTDFEKLKNVLLDYLDDYNGISGQDVKLILFQDAVEHITRLARLLRAERANGLLVGKFCCVYKILIAFASKGRWQLYIKLRRFV